MVACGWSVQRCGCGTSCWDTHQPATRDLASALAINLMWAATGRRYGLCEVTVQPCNPRRERPLYQVYPVLWDSYGGDGGSGPIPVIEDGQWYNRCGGGCRCRARCEVALEGPTTTARVSEVTVHGVVVAPEAYQVQDFHLLVRIDGQCWPTCVDYSKQDPPAFTVTYTVGTPIPPAVQAATEILACEFAKACENRTGCRLPNRLQSITRQGVEVSMAEVAAWDDMMRTNIVEVDQVIAADNPHRLQAPPMVLSPDLPPARRVT